MDKFCPTPGRNLLTKLFPHKSEDGFSLVEVLIALVILVIVILGGGLYFFYGRLGINREGYRRAALERASQRLEQLKAANYSDIALEPPSDQLYYITYGSSWNLTPDKTEDTISEDNLPDGVIVTQAQWVDEGSDESYDYLKVTVTVAWGDNPDNKVELVTLIAPWQA